MIGSFVDAKGLLHAATGRWSTEFAVQAQPILDEYTLATLKIIQLKAKTPDDIEKIDWWTGVKEENERRLSILMQEFDIVT